MHETAQRQICLVSCIAHLAQAAKQFPGLFPTNKGQSSFNFPIVSRKETGYSYPQILPPLGVSSVKKSFARLSFPFSHKAVQTMRKAYFLAFALCLSMSLAVMPAFAAEPRKIGEYGDWSAFAYTENDAKVCYMASEPSKHEGKYEKRGEIFALVTHRPADGTRSEFSYIAGYPYKKDSVVTLKIDANTFELFTHDETAWAPDGKDESIVQALRKGTVMTVKGTSAKGTETFDTFGLKGSSAAHAAISRECGTR